MAITQDEFNKIWASTSSVPEYTFSDTDYKNGWEFVGNLPPTRAMWDELQRKNDEKMQFLQENGSMCFDSVTDMKSSNLDAGQTAFTKGYYSINDGGSSIYAIRAKTESDTEDGKYIIFLNNGNVAEWISQNDYLSYKDVDYAETITEPALKSLHQAKVDFAAQKSIDEAEGTLTVATFNVFTQTSARHLSYLAYIPVSKQITTMLMTKAQLIGLDEVNSGPAFVAADLYNADGTYIDNQTAFYDEFSGYDYGNMIESVYTATSKTSGVYNHQTTEHNGYANMVVTIGTKTVSFYSSHLDYRSYESAQTQLEELYNIVNADTSDYKIVVGDLNLPPEYLGVFTNAGYNLVNVGQYQTFGDKAIDNIIISPNIEIISSGQLNVASVPDDLTGNTTFNRGVSDHDPLWARLRFN